MPLEQDHGIAHKGAETEDVGSRVLTRRALIEQWVERTIKFSVLLSLLDLAACGAKETVLNKDHAPQAVLVGETTIDPNGLSLRSDPNIAPDGEGPNTIDWSNVVGVKSPTHKFSVTNALLVKGNSDPNGVGLGGGSWIEFRTKDGLAYAYFGFDNDTLLQASQGLLNVADKSGRSLTSANISLAPATLRDEVTASTSSQATVDLGQGQTKTFQAAQLSVISQK
ncbi:MAG TPA: hypothetical protein VFQ63_02730 [Patescibacteria group bacterium]|nr:hypothetical protein [Patescibacteria group bacterium]